MTSHLPVQGSPNYLSDLILQLRDPDQDGFDFDSRIFIAMLLCLVARKKNMIVDIEVDEDDFEGDLDKKELDRIAKQAEKRAMRMIELIATNIFGLRTLLLSLSAQFPPASLPQSFIPAPPPNPHSGPPIRPLPRSRRSSSRQGSYFSQSYGLSSRRSASSRGRSVTRSEMGGSTLPGDKAYGSPVMNAERNPFDDNLYTPIAPITAKGTPLTSSPEALQISVDLPADLREQRIEPVKIDPSNNDNLRLKGEQTTITPYVNERPPLPEILVLNRLDKASYDTQMGLYQILCERQIRVPSGTKRDKDEFYGNGSVSGEYKRKDKHDDERDEDRILPLPENFMCIWVRAPVRVKKTVPTCLLGHFSFSCTASPNAIDGEDEYEEPMEPLQSTARIPDSHLQTSYLLALKTHLHPPLRLLISDLTSCVMHHPQLYSNMTVTFTVDFREFVRIARVLFRPFEWRPDLLDPNIKSRQYDQRRKLKEALEREDWYGTDEDVKMVWGNLVGHIVGLRKEEEELIRVFKVDDDAGVKRRRRLRVSEERLRVVKLLKHMIDVV